MVCDAFLIAKRVVSLIVFIFQSNTSTRFFIMMFTHIYILAETRPIQFLKCVQKGLTRVDGKLFLILDVFIMSIRARIKVWAAWNERSSACSIRISHVWAAWNERSLACSICKIGITDISFPSQHNLHNLHNVDDRSFF